MKLIVLSDFHGKLPVINEMYDLMVIAGDISPFRIQGNKELMKDWFEDEFYTWIDNLKIPKVIITPGNHDFYFEGNVKRVNDLQTMLGEKVSFLINNYIEYNELKIFGTPYCTIFGNWPFMREPKTLSTKFSKIPEGLDILITHDPPYGIGECDMVLEPKYNLNDSIAHLGSPELKERLLEMKNPPKYIFCGHIHTGDHNCSEYLGMKVYNVSLMDENCDILRYNPLEIEIFPQ